MTWVLYLIIACGALSIAYGVWTTRAVLASDPGTARMHERTLERLGPRTPARGDVIRLAEQPPRFREPDVVAESLELRDHRLCDAALVARSFRVRISIEEAALDHRAKLEAPVGDLSGGR